MVGFTIAIILLLHKYCVMIITKAIGLSHLPVRTKLLRLCRGINPIQNRRFLHGLFATSLHRITAKNLQTRLCIAV